MQVHKKKNRRRKVGAEVYFAALKFFKKSMDTLLIPPREITVLQQQGKEQKWYSLQ